MPEPDTDKFRDSAALSKGLKNPGPQLGPTRPYLYSTDDEIYQFRNPNTAYGKPSTQKFELPVNLETDGTQPRKWGDSLLPVKE